SAKATHDLPTARMDEVLSQRAEEEHANRQAILHLMQRPEVRDLAGHVGLSLERVEAAVATLEGPELRQLASQARRVDNAVAGGASKITVSTTTVIIGLLILILIIVAVD
ncbi:MAG: hypothetical protein ACE5JI_15800, partial [Acidobacteriota bacterium]